MKVTNVIIRISVILTTIAALLIFFFIDDYENSALGSTISVLISSVAIFVVTYLPNIFKKRNIEMSKALYIIVLTSILLSMGGGFIFRFYEVFNYYDTIVHFLNGGIIVLIAFVIIKFLAKDSNEKGQIPVMIFIAILVSISLGTIWEIYEFAVDLIIDGSNMQRWAFVGTLVPKVGQEALKDTMVDLTVDTLGAILAGLLIFLDFKNNSKYINKIKLSEIEENLLNE